MRGIRNDENNNNDSIFGKLKASFSGRKFRSGAYVSILSTVIVVLVLVVNLIASEMDLKIDMSTQGLYTLTDKTVQLVKNVEDDISIYYLVESGKEAPIFQNIAQKYDSLSNKVTLMSKDPVLYPQFASQYVNDEVNVNSFLVVNETTGRARYIDGTQMIVRKLDERTMNYVLDGIDVEGRLTSAIQFVTNPNPPTIYRTIGHGEKEFESIFLEALDKQNVTVKTLATLTTNTIPEDCNILFIHAPAVDFTEEEIGMIKDYLATGGNVIINIDYTAYDKPNINALLEYYGIEMVPGIICEGDSSRYIINNPFALIPNVLNHDLTQGAASTNKFIAVPVSSGLNIAKNIRGSLNVEAFLTTSDKAFSKVNIYSQNLYKEPGDIDGPFNVGLIATDTYKNITSNLVVFSSSPMFDNRAMETFGNAELIVGTVGYLSGDTEAVAIRTRSFTRELLKVSQSNAALWGAVTAIIIPVLILAIGLFISIRRRRR